MVTCWALHFTSQICFFNCYYHKTDRNNINVLRCYNFFIISIRAVVFFKLISTRPWSEERLADKEDDDTNWLWEPSQPASILHSSLQSLKTPWRLENFSERRCFPDSLYCRGLHLEHRGSMRHPRLERAREKKKKREERNKAGEAERGEKEREMRTSANKKWIQFSKAAQIGSIQRWMRSEER